MNKVVFADGFELTGFTLNGTLLCFKEAVNPSDLTVARLKTVEVIADAQRLCYHNAKVTFLNSGAIAFTERSSLEVLKETIDAKIDYLALMSDIDLEA